MQRSVDCVEPNQSRNIYIIHLQSVAQGTSQKRGQKDFILIQSKTHTHKHK